MHNNQLYLVHNWPIIIVSDSMWLKNKTYFYEFFLYESVLSSLGLREMPTNNNLLCRLLIGKTKVRCIQNAAAKTYRSNFFFFLIFIFIYFFCLNNYNNYNLTYITKKRQFTKYVSTLHLHITTYNKTYSILLTEKKKDFH